MASDGGDPKRPPLLAWIWPVPLGLVIGAVALGPYFRSPSDPSGQFIGAGWGGLIGLLLAIALRITRPSKRGK
jgi:hypothetical protein